MSVGWPQGILLAFMAISLVKAAVLDGEPRTDKHRFGVSAIDAAITFGLLWWGGFFA